ncbi:MAG: CotH kinase family protein [Verrucomicrobia bacterium]|nr:CotH kinase family protein [Verrucomicrobiota bacterium]
MFPRRRAPLLKCSPEPPAARRTLASLSRWLHAQWVTVAFSIGLLTLLSARAQWPVQFDPEAGYWPQPLSLRLQTTNADAVVRFSLSGSEPGVASTVASKQIFIQDRSGNPNLLSAIPGTATVNQHTDGWAAPRGPIAKATVVRAAAFGPGTNRSAALSHTYFIGTNNPMRRYGLPVVSLSIATNDLFNYTNGIYVLGKIFDDYVKAHPAEPLTGHTPANYTQRGPAWGRPGFFEWFDPDGVRRVAQPVELDIQGQSSRSFREKSLGVKAKGDDLFPGKFHFTFFPGLTNRQGEALTSFDHLRLSNSGNDWTYSMFRDALCHVLAGPVGFDTLAYRPAIVYLDGEFWGIHNLREQEDPDFLFSHYGVDPAEAVICESIGSVVDGLPTDNLPFLALRSFIETNDLTLSTNYAYVASLMDIQNFIAYQASEIYFANADWPHNNIRYWRRRLATNDPTAPIGLDGRWRWFLFDVDLGYGHPWSGGFGDDTLAAAISPTGRPGIDAPWSTMMLRRLLTNPGFKRDFVNTMADMLNTAYRESRATNLVNTLQAAIAPAIPDHIYRWRSMGDSTNGWRDEVYVLRLFAAQRPTYVRQHMIANLGLTGFANVTLDCDPRGAGEFQLNTARINERAPGVNATNAFPWKGTYFRGVPIHLQALAKPGYRFLGWSKTPLPGETNDITIALKGNTNWVARFERIVAPHNLAASPYELLSWSSTEPAGAYPPHAFFEQTTQKDPGLDAPMTGLWTLPYRFATRSRLVGLQERGVGFINTSDPQNSSNAGFAGSLVVAIQTTGIVHCAVSWIGGTVETNSQIYAIRLQYAVGDGSFSDLVGSDGKPVEYIRSGTPGDQALIGPTRLPPQCENQPFVRLRWKYYRVTEGKGARAELRVDDLWIDSDLPPAPARFTTVELGAEGMAVHFEGTARSRYQVSQSSDLKNWSADSESITDLDGKGSFHLNREPTRRASFIRLIGAEP